MAIRRRTARAAGGGLMIALLSTVLAAQADAGRKYYGGAETPPPESAPVEPASDIADDQSGLEVATTLALAHAAMASLTATQVIEGNRVEDSADRRALITHSFIGNAGIASANQESGNLNSQLNVRVIALTEEQADGVLTGVDLSAYAVRRDNTVVAGGGERRVSIVDSFADGTGIVGVNQAAGNLNRQANLLVMALGMAPGANMHLLGDAALDETASNNTVVSKGAPAPQIAELDGAFKNFEGIAQVSQVAGDLNSTTNAVAVSYRETSLP